MVKKTTLKEVGELLAHFVKHIATKDDIKDMATKSDVRGIIRGELKPLATRLIAVESKVSGIDRRLDAEAIRREDEKIPARVLKLEKKVFGT